MEIREQQHGEIVLSFHYVGPGDQSQFLKVGCKHLFSLSHLDGPLAKFGMYNQHQQSLWLCNKDFLPREPGMGPLPDELPGKLSPTLPWTEASVGEGGTEEQEEIL